MSGHLGTRPRRQAGRAPIVALALLAAPALATCGPAPRRVPPATPSRDAPPPPPPVAVRADAGAAPDASVPAATVAEPTEAEAAALDGCSRHVVGTVPTAAEPCRQLADTQARTLPVATRRCAAGEAALCFVRAMLQTGQVPLGYRAALAPHEGSCPPGAQCRRAATRFWAGRIAPGSIDAEVAARVVGPACESGSVEACLWQGALLGNRDVSVPTLLRACDAGRAVACVVPLDRLPSIHPGSSRAAERLRAACDAADPLACATVAATLAEGYGRPRDLRAAVALYARTCGRAAELTRVTPPVRADDPATLADERFATDAADERLYACAGLLGLAGRDASARRALRGSAAVPVVAAACAGDRADGSSCAALAGALERGVGGRADRPRASLARAAACAGGHRESCRDGG